MPLIVDNQPPTLVYRKTCRISLALASVTLGAALTFVDPVLGCFGIAAAQTTDPDTVREEDRLGARSDQYSRVFDQAVSALVAGDAAKFRSLLSSTTVLSETRGPGAVDVIIQDKFIPFFSDFDQLTDSIATMPTFDSRGETGIAIARSFITKSGSKKSFVIYLIGEKKPVVGNLLLNTTEEYLLKNKGKPG